MSEGETFQQGFILTGPETHLPTKGNYKYVHIGEGSHFGVDHPAALLVGNIDLGHRDIAASYFKSIGGKDVNNNSVQQINYENAGLLKANESTYLLMGNSGGLYGTNAKGTSRVDMMTQNSEEKWERDKKTIAIFKGAYPDKTFHSLEETPA